MSVQKVYCGKTADWIQMPFGMVSGSVEGWGGYRRRQRVSFGVEFGRATVTNWDFATRLFPNYFGQYSFLVRVPYNLENK